MRARRASAETRAKISAALVVAWPARRARWAALKKQKGGA
jgi:hypothetical protein